MMKLTTLFFLLLFRCAGCQEPEEIDFKTLSHMQVSEGALVQIRGFLYEAEGQSILAAEPNLKSCCLGAPGKIDTQILVSGSFSLPSTQRAIAMQGELHIADSEDDGEIVALYYLKNAKILEDSDFSYSMLFYGFALVVGIVFFWSIIRRLSCTQ